MPRIEGGNHTKKFKVCSVRTAKAKEEFQDRLQCRHRDPSYLENPTPHMLWSHLKLAVPQTSKETLGFFQKKNQDWTNENDQQIKELLTRKSIKHQVHLTQPSCPCKKEVFCLPCSNVWWRFWYIQNEWWINLAEKKTELCTDTGDLRGFCEALQAV